MHTDRACRLCISILPLDWRRFRRERSLVARLFNEAADSGVGRNGMTFPIRGRLGEKAIFSITSDLRDAEWRLLSRPTNAPQM